MNGEIDWRYWAGLFDGEGCVGVYFATDKPRNMPVLRVSISNTCKEILDVAADIFRGSVSQNSNPKPCFLFQLASRQAESFLNGILPFSFVKKNRIEECLAEYNSYIKYSGRKYGIPIKKYNKLVEEEG